jgi:hypothetical protein
MTSGPMGRYATRRSSCLTSCSSIKTSGLQKAFVSSRSAPLMPPLALVRCEPPPAPLPRGVPDDPIVDFEVKVQMGTARVLNRGDLVLRATAPLPPVGAPGFGAAFAGKMQIVDAECFFDDPSADIRAKGVKWETLHELLDFADRSSDLPPGDLDIFVQTICKPIFRPMGTGPLLDDGIAVLEPAWTHYSLHYQIMDALIQNVPSLRTRALAWRLSRCLDRPDLAERTALAGLLQSLWRGQRHLCEPIAKMVCNTLVDYVEGLVSPHAVVPALLTFLEICRDDPPSDDIPRFTLYSRAP